MPKLYTTGYEQHDTPDALVSALKEVGIERLVDVRELPLSRRRGFSKKALSAALEFVGVRYDHVRPLGNPKPYRDLYRAGRQAEGEAGYLAHIRNGSAREVDKLAEELSQQATCLLCFEADHTTCHRDLLVEELHVRLPGLQVDHLP